MLDRKLLLGTTMIAGFAATLMVAPTVAMAQPAAPPATSTAADDEDDEDGSVEALVVTGSRIKRSEFTAPAPIQVITAEQSSLEGLVDTAEILQGSTLASGSSQQNNQLTGFLTNGGGGVQTLSLRGLGEQRTLFLLNGRRAGPAGTRGQVGAFDLNVIPASIIERIEILKDGASSIYGSDAVAGVVNIITKSNLDGIELNAYGNQSFDGGGEYYRLNGAWGKTFDRGYINISGEYFKQNALVRGDRDDLSCTADYLSSGRGEPLRDIESIDGGKVCYTQATYVTAGGINYTPIRPGFTYPTPQQGNNSAFPGFARFSRAGFPLTYAISPVNPFALQSTVLSPVERYTGTLNFGVDLGPAVELYGEFLYNNRQSGQRGAAQIFPSFATNPTLPGALSNSLPTGNPGNAFGAPATFVIGYPSDSNQDINYYRGVLGFRGEIPVMGGLSWDIFYQYSRSDGDYDLGERIYLDRFRATAGYNTACNPNPVGGNISGFSCADVAALPGGFIPWTSARVLNGQFTDAERDFLFFKETGNTTYEHQYLEGSISGDLFTLPAGPVGAAVGFQLRREEINDTPGPMAIAKNISLVTTSGITKGDDSIGEVFGEVEIPIFRGLPALESLTANLSGRYSNYDSYGDSTTYKAGLNWQITPAWRIRATRGTSFRAPALYELYLGAQTGFLAQSQIDPCYTTDGVYDDPNVDINCAAVGIDGIYTGTQYVPTAGGSGTILTGGGAGILTAETAEATTLGIIWTPSFIDLSVAVDYFDIKVEDEVRNFGAGNIGFQCYNSDPAQFATNPFCSLITRDATSKNIVLVNDNYVNVAEQVNRGIDLTWRYTHEFDFGRFTWNSTFTWQLKDTTDLLGGVTEDYNGTTNQPDFTGETNFRFDRGDWTVFWGIDMIGKASDTDFFGGDTFTSTRYGDCTFDPTAPGPNQRAACSTFLNAGGTLANPGTLVVNAVPVYYKQYTEFTAYHDVSIRKRWNDWTFSGGIQNLFDERPPSQSTGQSRVGTAAINIFDVVGRRAFISISKRW